MATINKAIRKGLNEPSFHTFIINKGIQPIGEVFLNMKDIDIKAVKIATLVLNLFLTYK